MKTKASINNPTDCNLTTKKLKDISPEPKQTEKKDIIQTKIDIQEDLHKKINKKKFFLKLSNFGVKIKRVNYI